MGLLDGKNGVVTGAGRGLGRAYAMAMAAAGAKVVINDIDLEVAEEVAKEIKAAGGEAIADNHSITDFDQAGQLIQNCVDSFGKIDFVLNNAGILRDRMSWNMSYDDWTQVFDVHVTGTFNCSRQAMTHMRAQQSGSIINVTSGSQYGNTGQSNYSAAKGAISSATYTWALELSRYGVRVNAISPTAKTRMTASIPEGARQLRAARGMGNDQTSDIRMGEPEQVAPLAVYLASDEAYWISGQIVALGGEQLALIAHQKEKKVAFKNGGWTVDDIVRFFRMTVGTELEPCGRQPYYQWYEGVAPKQS